MPITQLGSPESRYLAATDVLIGDMSDINYEFLLFDRPVILLANRWLQRNFPDIGLKTDLVGLAEAISRSLAGPDEFAAQRQLWLEKTIESPYENASSRVLDICRRWSGISEATLVAIHGGSDVRATNLFPVYKEAMRCGMRGLLVRYGREAGVGSDRIYVAAHFADLKTAGGYRVHLDHGLKGVGTANVEMSRADYRANGHFPHIDLHIVAGDAGLERTQMLLGPYADRAVVGGYPKGDDLNRHNTKENRLSVLEELGFPSDVPLVTYAPAGVESNEKPGGSLSPRTLSCLEQIAVQMGINVLIKLKSPRRPLWRRFADRAMRACDNLLLASGCSIWRRLPDAREREGDRYG